MDVSSCTITMKNDIASGGADRRRRVPDSLSTIEEVPYSAGSPSMIGYSSQTPVNRGYAPIAVTLAGNEKENKTIKHRQFTPIQYGPEAMWRVRLEVGDCHFSAGDECGN